MCGIFAVLHRSATVEDRLVYSAALASLRHRGPDNVSSWFSDRVFLGHTRLAIVGLGTSSDQPFIFDNLILLFNGEVFNYIEIRQQLTQVGYSFETGSDTEVVIKAYHYFGARAFSMFNGMWALVIHNKLTNETIVCRDRFGQKPLFIGDKCGKIVISSELHAIAKVVSPIPNLSAICLFVLEGSYSVKGNTFFSNVFEVPKACYIHFRGEELVESVCYWEYPGKSNQNEGFDLHFIETLYNSVEIRLRTEVDYCMLLSGGVDSTIIAGLTRQLAGNSKNLTAFTFSSGDDDDEKQYAQFVAKELGVCLHVVETNESAVEYIESLKRLVKLLGRGHSSPAIVSVDKIYNCIGKMGYKVALDGQGADEMLAGYKHYHYHLICDSVSAGRWGEIPALVSDLKAEGAAGVAIMAMRSSLPEWGRSIMRRAFGYESIINKSFYRKLEDSPYEVLRKNPDGYNCFDRYLIKQHKEGLSNLLYYGDIVSMANSIENRSPFMDHRLVEIAFRSDSKIKVDAGLNKSILRKTEVYSRFKSVLERKKVGFNTPIGKSIRYCFLKELQESKILQSPIFERQQLRDFLKSDEALEKKYERFVFRLFQIHLWHNEFIG
jgi:asparagine synthase (glutamine-hydrolysing)